MKEEAIKKLAKERIYIENGTSNNKKAIKSELSFFYD